MFIEVCVCICIYLNGMNEVIRQRKDLCFYFEIKYPNSKCHVELTIFLKQESF